MTTAKHLGPMKRYSSANGTKSEGATYTPRRLAQFVAEKMVGAWHGKRSGPVVRILDPAAGDGELLLALTERLRTDYPDLPLKICGFEPNPTALSIAIERLSKEFPDIPISIKQGDFLEHVIEYPDLDNQKSCLLLDVPDTYDLVIANPPYVRTQVMGAHQAQSLGRKFGLSGRVDLYHAFMLAIARIIEPETVSGLIVSNRFMTTRSGANVRSTILEKLDILSVWDFGDTKLFEAAVLPAVILANGTQKKELSSPINFTSIYETTLPHESWAIDPIDAISHRGIVEVGDGRRFMTSHGRLDTDGQKDGIWRIANETTEEWLGTVAQHTWRTFRDIGKVRVGVKTCADKIFIRSDWNQWPLEAQPELLRPIMTHHAARRFKAHALKEPKSILYPHETQQGCRRAVDLSKYPKSATYLESHRETLESRTYVTESGRNWFEIWVPQDPAAWSQEKLVFRDIAQDPTFWIDLDGSLVNGDCYWLTTEDPTESNLLWLAAAIGNSSFIERFYDYRFQNKLYAGRRRFMTQYVEQFPLPNPSHEVSNTIISKAKKVYASVGTKEGNRLEEELDQLVWEAFGLSVEEITR